MSTALWPAAICSFLLLAAALAAESPFAEPAQLPAQKVPPDALVMLNGDRVTTPEQWAGRRGELKRLFQHYMYGNFPPADVRLHAVAGPKPVEAFGGKATLAEVTLAVKPDAPGLNLLVVVPTKRAGKVPVFLGINFCGNHAVVTDPSVKLPAGWMYPDKPGVKGNRATEAGRGTQTDVWPVEAIIDRGYALATFYSGDVEADRADVREGVRAALGGAGADMGTVAAWAWGAQRAVDYLGTRADLDGSRIALVGHSRLGKATLLAAAFDERIALAIPHQAGCGGTAPSRGTVGESVQRINTAFPHWFNARFKQFNEHPDRLPFDQQCLMALVAPRPLLISNAVEDQWANPAGQFEMLRLADPVYKLLGSDGAKAEKMPEPGRTTAGPLAFFLRDGKHAMTREDWGAFLDFADTYLKGR